MTARLSGWFVIVRLGLAMINLRIKFETSLAPRITKIGKEMQDLENLVVWGYLGVTHGQWK